MSKLRASMEYGTCCVLATRNTGKSGRMGIRRAVSVDAVLEKRGAVECRVMVGGSRARNDGWMDKVFGEIKKILTTTHWVFETGGGFQSVGKGTEKK